MAPLKDYSNLRKKKVLILFYLLLVFFTSSLLLISANNEEVVEQEAQKRFDFFGRRALQLENEDNNNKKPTIKKKLASLSTKNQTKLAAKTTNSSSSSSSAKNQTTKLSDKNGNKEGGSSKIIIKLPSDSLKNKTKIKTKPTSDSISNEKPTMKSQLKKLNSTSKPSSFPKNSTLLNKKSSDLHSNNSNKTGKATKEDLGSSTTTTTTTTESKSKPKIKNATAAVKDKSPTKKPKTEKGNLPKWVDPDDDENDEDDLVSGFRDLPSKFQESLFPDLERISKTSQVYLNKANKQITKGFKPIVGNKYAPTIASIVSCAFILIPLLLVSLIVNRIKAYFSLQKILIFIQIYLSIYFTILCLSSLATGLEPLRFFYATSQSTYVGLLVFQTLAYVLYLLLLLMYLILIFSTETGILTKLLGLGQTFVGFIVGLHYYIMVFHRAVLHQPPKTSWKVHAIYATCFLAISLLTRADRRKKAYVGGEEGKMS